ncbi:MAG: rRNA maturation RNase YbeY [Patescibacteria group bacterium]|nr:rRNA maturation RNase YbeY [Patescibacteria group bacterium]
MVEINNLTTSKINKVFLKKISQKVLKKEKKENSSLSIALIGSARMRKLNKKYRGKNRSTDVLSFAEDLDFLGKSKELKKLNVLGEVVICIGNVKKNAKRLNVSFKKELTRVLIHGILHILGYDHEISESKAKLMRERENYYLSNIF